MNDRTFRFRPALPGDAEAIMNVHVRAILELGVSAYTSAEVESWAAKLRPEGYAKVMIEGAEYFEVAIDVADAVIGFCSVAGNEIKGLYIDPGWARLGIASAFIGRAERRIGEAGHQSVIIGAARSGLLFYLARGYTAEEEVEWETRGGLVLDATNMRKQL